MSATALLAAIVTCCLSASSIAAENKSPVATQTTVFAGGCFWCVEAALEKLEGVSEVVSGYTGGHIERPSYEQVSAGNTGHYEAVEVVYDPQRVTYEQLLKTFWNNIDPYDDTGQFCDKGDQYRAAIFFSGAEQQKAAEASKHELEMSGALVQPIVTQILPAQRFWPAEDYHQDYYKKNPLRYRYYRTVCGRDRRLNEVWSEVDLEAILTDKEKATK
ncbi:MAG: peptide-methionine (S)-S-oxide reductase MsrA [Gammaproteobacteria bacterium]